MSKTRLDGQFKGANHILKVVLDLIEFQEGKIFYVFCPALNLYGYDHSTENARKSFSVVLEEYFRYTSNKKTLEDDLKKQGWSINKRGKQPVFKTPDLSKLLIDNEEYVDIMNKHNYTKYSKKLEVPVNA